MYVRGMSTREIEGHLKEMYGVSPALVSQVAEAAIDEVRIRQSRRPDAIYPTPYLDALYVKVRDKGQRPLFALSWLDHHKARKLLQHFLRALFTRRLENLRILI